MEVGPQFGALHAAYSAPSCTVGGHHSRYVYIWVTRESSATSLTFRALPSTITSRPGVEKVIEQRKSCARFLQTAPCECSVLS